MTVQLMHGDCLVRMVEIPDGSVDMILADLPYGTTACSWDNVIPFEPLWQHYWRVLKPNGAVVLFGSEPFSSHLRMSQIKHYRYDWIWKKPKGTGHLSAKFRPLNDYETISCFQKQIRYFPQFTIGEPYVHNKGKKHQSDCYNKEKLIPHNNDGKRHPKRIIQFNTVGKGGHHPTQKPIALLEYLIRTYTLEGETVLDNTMGSGSTGVAAVNLSRKFIGIEQDDKYFAIAQKRIADAQVPKELWS